MNNNWTIPRCIVTFSTRFRLFLWVGARCRWKNSVHFHGEASDHIRAFQMKARIYILIMFFVPSLTIFCKASLIFYQVSMERNDRFQRNPYVSCLPNYSKLCDLFNPSCLCWKEYPSLWSGIVVKNKVHQRTVTSIVNV